MTKAELALRQWAKGLKDGPVQCRAGYRHSFPDWLDDKTSVYKNRHTGACRIEADCDRDCGTFKVLTIGANGVLEHARVGQYSYDKDLYALPQVVLDALKEGDLKYKDVLAICRAEILNRKGKAGKVTVLSDEDF